MAGLIDPRKIRTDLGTQMRTAMDDNVVSDYANAMERGDQFPPIVVCYDEPQDMFVLADGFHRLAAHMRVRPNDQINADQILGGAESARWISIGANRTHGLRRTNADKRNAVMAALLHHKGTNLSDRQLAEHVGVANSFVGDVRTDLEKAGVIEPVFMRDGADGKRRRLPSQKPVSEAGLIPPADSACGNCDRFDGVVCLNSKLPRAAWEIGRAHV